MGELLAVLNLLLTWPGWRPILGLLVVVGAGIAWKEREQIGGYLVDLAARREARRPQSNGEIRDSLLRQMMEQLTLAQMERRTVTAELIEQAAGRRELERTAIDSLSLLVAELERQGARDAELCACLRDVTDTNRQLEKTVSAFAFLVAQMAFPGSKRSFEDVMRSVGGPRRDERTGD